MPPEAIGGISDALIDLVDAQLLLALVRVKRGQVRYRLVYRGQMRLLLLASEVGIDVSGILCDSLVSNNCIFIDKKSGTFILCISKRRQGAFVALAGSLSLKMLLTALCV